MVSRADQLLVDATEGINDGDKVDLRCGFFWATYGKSGRANLDWLIIRFPNSVITLWHNNTPMCGYIPHAR